MNPKSFTEEQIIVLRENPNTEYVSESVIRFTQEFRTKLIEAIKAGIPVRRFLQEAGYDCDILGAGRVKMFGHRMRKEAYAGNIPHAGYKERKRCPDLSDYKDMTHEEAMLHMQNEILYLHQELEFIKKIIELDSAGGQSK